MSEAPLYAPAVILGDLWFICEFVPGCFRYGTDRYSSQFKNNYFTEMCSGSKEGSYLRRIDLCITQL